MTHGTDNPAVVWVMAKAPSAGETDVYYSYLTATLNPQRGTENNNEHYYDSPRVAGDGSALMVVYRTHDTNSNLDSGIWCSRIVGGVVSPVALDKDRVGTPPHTFSTPDISYRGGVNYITTYTDTQTSAKKVIARGYTGSGWSGSVPMYNANSTEPYPRTIPYDSGWLISRASNGSDVQWIVTADDSKVLFSGVNPRNASNAIATACENDTADVYIAVVTGGNGIVVKRTDSAKPTTSGIVVTGNANLFEGIYYTGSNFQTGFQNVLDDWGLTGTDPLGDAFTGGVSKVAVRWSMDGNDPWNPLPTVEDNPVENAPWNATVDVGSLTDGNYYIKGILTDTAGNTANSPIAHVLIDRQLPTVSATVDTSPTSGDWRNRPTRVTITGSDTYLDHCEYRIDTGSWTRYTAPFAALQGQHNYGYRAVDLAGNSSGNSANLSLWVDSGSPSCQWDYPSGDIMQADRSDHVSLYATGADGTSGVSWIGLFVNGQKVAEADGNQQGCYWDVSSLPETTYTLTVKARDAAGNESTTTKTARLQKAQAVYGDTYFAEGTTRDGFDEYLCVLNPDQKNTASLTFSFQLETGQVITKSAAVPASSRSTFHVPDMVPAGHDVSTRIHSEGAFVIAERPMYFNYRGWTGGHTAVGINQLQQDYYFAEGTTRPGFDEWITLQNPNGSVATATVTYMLGTGENKDKTYTVPANTRVTVNVNADIGPGQDVSAKVHSDKPIAAERPMYFNYQNKWTGGQDVVGVTVPQQTWYFAEGTTRSGFDEWLCIQNPGASAANVTVNYSTGTAKRYSIAPHSRYTVNVNADVGADKDVSITVVSDQPVIAERPMYFNYNGLTGGSDVLGATETGVDFYFAEGTTRDGFSEFLTILTTAGAGNVVYVSYLFPDGKTVNKEHKLRANRETINVNEDVGPDKDVAIRISTHPQVGNNFVVERPMYFNYRGWTGGSTVAGYSLY
jgi:hypothetical protein